MVFFLLRLEISILRYCIFYRAAKIFSEDGETEVVEFLVNKRLWDTAATDLPLMCIFDTLYTIETMALKSIKFTLDGGVIRVSPPDIYRVEVQRGGVDRVKLP